MEFGCENRSDFMVNCSVGQGADDRRVAKNHNDVEKPRGGFLHVNDNLLGLKESMPR